MEDPRRFNTKAWLLWTAGFLAFPIAGALATRWSAGSTTSARPCSGA